ncbi:calcium-binding protein [Rubripirellula obstinata]|nr:calcium-binding protein [Rubripirellula obstinata]
MTSRKNSSCRSRSPRRLRGESLENRRVMAAAINLSSDGVLDISGDADANRVWVAQVSDQRLRVSIDGRHNDFDVAEVNLLRVQAGGGDDVVRIARNVDLPAQVFGGAGDDVLQAGSGPSWVQGGDGNDRLQGGAGVNILFGGAGHDRIFGGPANDYLIGGAGNDQLNGGAGDDWIFGDGTNSLPTDVTDPLAYARQYGHTNRGDDVINGGAGNDVVHGGRGNDHIRGGAGNDILFGGKGNDRIQGNLGDDLLIGGEGKDALNGGRGADTLLARDGEMDIIFADSLDEIISDGLDRIVVDDGLSANEVDEMVAELI